MFEIDKEKFGTFVAQLRKEKGLMQKDLAEKLYVSDKAVSKWERGLSIPDVSLLIPLAEVLGVTVTELLECKRIPAAEPMDPRAAEELVKKAIQYSDEHQPAAPGRGKRALMLLGSILVAAMEVALLVLLGHRPADICYALATPMLLMAIFGLYFCIFAREKAPRYYDENQISAYYDGFFRFNLPGLYINNRNLPYILQVGRIWSMAGLVSAPLLYWAIASLFPGNFVIPMVGITAVAVAGLFIPLYIVGQKHSGAAPSAPRKGSTIAFLLLAGAILVPLLTGPLGSLTAHGSGLRIGYTDSSTGDAWQARYQLLSGWRERTVNTDGQASTLHIDITTDGGTVDLAVKDIAGNTVFYQESIPTSSFDIEIPGTVTVRVTGEDHRGSFYITWE